MPFYYVIYNLQNYDIRFLLSIQMFSLIFALKLHLSVLFVFEGIHSVHLNNGQQVHLQPIPM